MWLDIAKCRVDCQSRTRRLKYIAYPVPVLKTFLVKKDYLVFLFSICKILSFKIKTSGGIVARLSQFITDLGHCCMTMPWNSPDEIWRRGRTNTGWNCCSSPLIKTQVKWLDWTYAQNPQDRSSKGYPLRWPTLLGECQTHMNMAVHGTGSTGITLYWRSSPDNHHGPSRHLA